MDSLLKEYIEINFSIEMQREVYRSFSLFERFGLSNIYENFINIITSRSYMSSDDMYDSFNNELNNKQDFILEFHKIETIEDCSFNYKNELLEGLFNIQNNENVEQMLSMLETFEDEHVVLSELLADNCNLQSTTILNVISKIDVTIIESLKNLLYSKEDNGVIVVKDFEKIKNRLKVFFILFGNNNPGFTLFNNGVILGEEINTYLPYLDGDIVMTDNDQTAKNLLSVLLMTDDSINDIIKTFKTISYDLIKDLSVITAVESKINFMLSKITTAIDIPIKTEVTI